MKKLAKNSISVQIPNLVRKHSLVSLFIPILLIGADSVLDNESNLYIRLFVRLVDKAFSEYMDAKRYMEEELKTGDKLAYGFSIINHLENCLNALVRVMNVFDIITVGMRRKGKVMKKDLKVLDFVTQKTVKEIKNYNVKGVRNRIEHIDEDIYLNRFKKDLFIKIDDQYQTICINNKCISLLELVRVMESYNSFVLEIFHNLPNRFEKDVYYYDKK